MTAFSPFNAFLYPRLHILVKGCPLENRKHIKREHEEHKSHAQRMSFGEEQRHPFSYKQVWHYGHLKEKNHLGTF
jgi:hypothetical protein